MSEPLPRGELVVRMQFDADAPKPGTGGLVSLYAETPTGQVAIRATFTPLPP